MIRLRNPDVVVVGAGIAGLTAAALLVRAGARVQVIEGHTVPGGCASFYQRAGFRFDVGATLVSGFGRRGVHRRLFELLGTEVEVQAVEPAMVVRLPDETVVRFGDARWPVERIRAFGESAEPFWREQERIADLAWDFSTRFPMLPVGAEVVRALAHSFRPRHAPLAFTLGRTIASILPAGEHRRLRAFIDAQLLITAQADAGATDLAYGSTALDIAREGTFHLAEGVSGIAIALARSVRRGGGEIAYGTSVARIVHERRAVRGVELADGTLVNAPAVVAAVPVQNVRALVGPPESPALDRVPALTQRWGAFMAYVGLPAGVVPDDCPLHHQLLADYDRPMGEGNTTFFSFSAPHETRRAREGGRAITISTHTDVALWERAFADGTYNDRKNAYAERLRAALERVVPGAWARATTIELATPQTFERYTGRLRGLVGGTPQVPATANLRALSHASGIAGLVLAGDTVFPGQSTVGASLSGVAAARALAPIDLSA